LQTNGTLIDQEWAELFKKFGFGVGVSLDGYKEINDSNRIFKGGRGSFESAMNGINILKQNNVNFGILSVMTRGILNSVEKYYQFVKEHNFRFRINPCLINKREHPELQILPDEWGEAMISLFDLWYQDNNPPMCMDFVEIIKSFFTGYNTTCVFNTSCFSDFLSVIPSGDMFPCARLIGEDEKFYLGNIKKDALRSILSKKKTLVRNYDRLGCEDCKWKRICYGGCTAHAYWAYGEINTRDYLCEGLKMLFSHIYQTVKNDLKSK